MYCHRPRRGTSPALCSKANCVEGEQRSKVPATLLAGWFTDMMETLISDWQKVKASESNIIWDLEESLWITETFADINVHKWPANICGTAATFCRRSSVIITAQGHYSHQDADQVLLYASLICKLAISTSCLPIQMFALFNQRRRSRPSESWCGKLVKVWAAAAAAACWIKPTGLGEDPFYTCGASYKGAGARSDLFLAWSHSLSTVLYAPREKPLFSFQWGATHSWKQNASLSSNQVHDLKNKIKKFLHLHTMLTLTMTSFSPLWFGFHVTSKRSEYHPA